MLSEIIYKRTYSRDNETWRDTIERVGRGLMALGWWGDDLEELKGYMYDRKGLVSGRSLWRLGAPGFTGDSLQSCWCVKNNKLSAFEFLFNELMLGGGVGFNVQAENVYELPVVKFDINVSCVDDNDCDLIVTDNREGWVELLSRVLDSFFYSGKDLRYSVRCVRVAGSKIGGFGGLASGPEALVTGIQRVAKLLKDRVGKKLRPIDCLDINNIIGVIVVSGNVRRSSEIAIGDSCDKEFINSKEWPYPNWRSMSNLSVACDRIEDFCGWDTFDSDPIGFVNLRNLRRYGRLIDGVNNVDELIIGCNPCGEIGLEDREPCNLAEIFLPNIRDYNELERVGYLLLKACKLITMSEFGDNRTMEVVGRNRRIGIGLAGLAQVKVDFKDLGALYQGLRYQDKIISQRLGINESIKLTTVKPGGTMCLLAGCVSGMGDAVGEWVNRRVRFSSSDELLEKLKFAGYHVEPQLNMDGSIDPRTSVVSFPVHYKNARTGSGVIKLLEIQRNLQTYWADNCISCTHEYTGSDVPYIKDWMKKYYNECVKTTCFSPKVTGFKQMPIEAISREEYNRMKDVKSIEIGTGDIVGDCDKGGCPVR